MAQTIRSRTVFSIADDLELLKEVVHTNPFESLEKWALIADKMSGNSKCFSVRTLKDRVMYLLNKFRRTDLENRRR